MNMNERIPLEEWKAKKQAEREALGQKQLAAMESFCGSGKALSVYLYGRGRLGSRLSSGNAALVLQQIPLARAINPMRIWNQNGRSVNKGAKGITVLSRKGNGKGYYLTPETVFDVSQTNGDTMAEAFRGKNVTRHSAEEISKALGVGVDQAFRFESTETALAGKTLREYALFARQVLQFASDHYGTVQPAFALPEKRSRPRFVDCLHEDEVKTLLNYLPNCNMTEQAIVLALLNTGMRRGELAGLTWEDLDFKQCTVHVYKSLLVFDTYGYQLTTTKESNDRYIDVAPEFMEAMKKYYDFWKCQRKLMGASWQTSIEKKRCKYPDSLRALAGNNFVISDDHGWPLSPDSYASIVKRIGDKAGIRHLHPHMFRHTFVSILMSNPDIGVATVAAEAGHAQPSTTLMIYTQQYKKRQESIRNQLSRELYGT